MSMATDESQGTHATAAEVATALVALSDADLIRLKRVAQLRSAGLSAVTWEDLLNEAVTRSLAGARVWPLDVPFIAFMAQTIRSIASEERRRIEHEQTSAEADLQSGEDDNQPITDMAINDITPERQVVARRTLKAIEDLFQYDREAEAILRGFAEGATPEQIQVSAALTPTQYASAQRRIRRQLARHFSGKEN